MNAPTARLRYGMGRLSSTELGPVVGDNCRNGVFCKAITFSLHRLIIVLLEKKLLDYKPPAILFLVFLRCGADAVAHRMHPTPRFKGRQLPIADIDRRGEAGEQSDGTLL